MIDIVIVLIVLIKNILRVMEFSEIEDYPKTVGASVGGGGGEGGFGNGGSQPFSELCCYNVISSVYTLFLRKDENVSRFSDLYYCTFN